MNESAAMVQGNNGFYIEALCWGVYSKSKSIESEIADKEELHESISCVDVKAKRFQSLSAYKAFTSPVFLCVYGLRW